MPSPRSSVATVHSGRGSWSAAPAARHVAHPVEGVDPGEADERVDLAQPLHREHPGDLRPQVLAARPPGQRQPAAASSGGRRADPAAGNATRDEQVDRIPVRELPSPPPRRRRCRAAATTSAAHRRRGRRCLDLAVKHVAQRFQVVAYRRAGRGRARRGSGRRGRWPSPPRIPASR